MRNIQKILIGVFCAGVFLCGLGCGIAFLEFSSFTYMGEKEVGETSMRTDTLEYSLEEQESGTIGIGRNYGNGGEDIQESAQVPEGMVFFRVTYNEKRVEPYLCSSDGHLWLGCEWKTDDFADLMTCKDLLLEGAKNRQISSFKTTGIEKVEILVNPESRDNITVEW